MDSLLLWIFFKELLRAYLKDMYPFQCTYHLQGLNSNQRSLVNKNYAVPYDIKSMDYKIQMNRRNVLVRIRVRMSWDPTPSKLSPFIFFLKQKES